MKPVFKKEVDSYIAKGDFMNDVTKIKIYKNDSKWFMVIFKNSPRGEHYYEASSLKDCKEAAIRMFGY